MDWRLAALFAAGCALGLSLGGRVGARLAKRRGLLTQVFAGLITVMAAKITWTGRLKRQARRQPVQIA